MEVESALQQGFEIIALVRDLLERERRDREAGKNDSQWQPANVVHCQEKLLLPERTQRQKQTR